MKTYRLTTYTQKGVDSYKNTVYVITDHNKGNLNITTHTKNKTRFDIVKSSVDDFVKNFHGVQTLFEAI